MSEEFDGKLERFERLWDGVTPKGINRSKSIKFRQYMRQHVLQKFHKKKKDKWESADKGHLIIIFQARISFSRRKTAASTGWASCRRKSAIRKPSEAIV